MMLIVTEWTKVLSQYLTHVMMQATSNAVLGHLRSPLARELNQKEVLAHITRVFQTHLLQKRDSHNTLVYEERIRNMCIGTALFYVMQTASSLLHEARIVKHQGIFFQQKLQ